MPIFNRQSIESVAKRYFAELSSEPGNQRPRPLVRFPNQLFFQRFIPPPASNNWYHSRNGIAFLTCQLSWVGTQSQPPVRGRIRPLFAAQALAVIRDTGLDPDNVNPLGGAIALGHPLGATGAVLSAKLIHGLRRRQQKYGMVTMCIGTGMGTAGIFEAV